MLIMNLKIMKTPKYKPDIRSVSRDSIQVEYDQMTLNKHDVI